MLNTMFTFKENICNMFGTIQRNSIQIWKRALDVLANFVCLFLNILFLDSFIVWWERQRKPISSKTHWKYKPKLQCS